MTEEHGNKSEKNKSEKKDAQEGTVSESTANPTPPDEEPATAPDVHDTPQTPPDHQQDHAH